MTSPLEHVAAAFVAADFSQGATAEALAALQGDFREALALVDASAMVSRMHSDGRAVGWRVRLMLFDSRDELMADTDPELEPDMPGSDVVRGLPAVLEWAYSIAALFHRDRGEKIIWLSEKETATKLKSLRPTLSRRGGFATWKLDYTAEGERWRAVIDVRKEDEPAE